MAPHHVRAWGCKRQRASAVEHGAGCSCSGTAMSRRNLSQQGSRAAGVAAAVMGAVGGAGDLESSSCQFAGGQQRRWGRVASWTASSRRQLGAPCWVWRMIIWQSASTAGAGRLRLQWFPRQQLADQAEADGQQMGTGWAAAGRAAAVALSCPPAAPALQLHAARLLSVLLQLRATSHCTSETVDCAAAHLACCHLFLPPLRSSLWMCAPTRRRSRRRWPACTTSRPRRSTRSSGEAVALWCARGCRHNGSRSAGRGEAMGRHAARCALGRAFLALWPTCCAISCSTDPPTLPSPPHFQARRPEEGVRAAHLRLRCAGRGQQDWRDLSVRPGRWGGPPPPLPTHPWPGAKAPAAARPRHLVAGAAGSSGSGAPGAVRSPGATPVATPRAVTNPRQLRAQEQRVAGGLAVGRQTEGWLSVVHFSGSRAVFTARLSITS